jgi:ankyrin repeat protein
MTIRVGFLHFLLLLTAFPVPLLAGPLHDAVRDGDVGTAEALIDNANLEESDFVLGTPLHVAVNTGDITMMQLLIAAGSAIEAPSELLGMRPIHLAVNTGDVDTLRFLISSGADVNSITAVEGETALHIAVRLGDENLVDVLIENSALIDRPEPAEGFTPLHSASLQGQEEIVRRLIEAGADPEARTDTGQTTLMLAASLESVRNVGDFSLVRYIAGLGVDLDAADTAGLTALSQVAGRGGVYVEIADVLRALGASK